ncbi:MAG: PHP domain-containing protein [Clostridia bacterium]|nr:PHP domain-containing protein [Clostridia bacterium]
MMYKLELHCHSSEVSACSHCPAETLIRRYREAGYHGIVSTNHINRATFRDMEERSWEEKTDHFMLGYHLLRDAAGSDFDVLLACEINLTPTGWPAYIPNDYLVYGVTEDWLRHAGDMRDMSLETLSACVREAGFLIVHAHPFRAGTVMMNPDLLDGFEIYNGNARHNSHNDLARVWAKMNGKIMTSGSDFHQPDDPCCGGIETETRIRDNETLLAVLRGGQYELFPPHRINYK